MAALLQAAMWHAWCLSHSVLHPFISFPDTFNARVHPRLKRFLPVWCGVIACSIFLSSRSYSLSPSGAFSLAVKTAVILDNAQIVGCSHGRLRVQLQQQDRVAAEAQGDAMRSAVMLKKFSDAKEIHHTIFGLLLQSSSHDDKCVPLRHLRFLIHPQSKKKHIPLQQQITRRCLCFPHWYLFSSFPSHLSHLSCNRLSPFAGAQAFMEDVPQGVRVIVRFFLKAGVKSKGNSGVHRISDVGGWHQQSTSFVTVGDLTRVSLQIAIRPVALVNLMKCLVLFITSSLHLTSLICLNVNIIIIIFVIRFYFRNLLLCVFGGAKEYLMPPVGKRVLLKLRLQIVRYFMMFYNMFLKIFIAQSLCSS